MSNNFSSVCYSCCEYQTAVSRFVTSRFVAQISSRMRNRRYRRPESSRQRQSHLLHRQALWRRFAKGPTLDPPPQLRLTYAQLDGFRKRASESYLPLNRLLRKILYRKYRAERRDLLGRDTTFVCYSSQE